jgi:hypothetical protein
MGTHEPVGTEVIRVGSLAQRGGCGTEAREAE